MDESNVWSDEIYGKNGVWTMVDDPRGRRAIGTKWVLKSKLKVDGTVKRHKALRVLKDYIQQKRVDFKQTFSLTIWMTTLCLILAIVASIDLELHQMYFNTTLINGQLEEKICMEQLECVM